MPGTHGCSPKAAGAPSQAPEHRGRLWGAPARGPGAAGGRPVPARCKTPVRRRTGRCPPLRSTALPSALRRNQTFNAFILYIISILYILCIYKVYIRMEIVFILSICECIYPRFAVLNIFGIFFSCCSTTRFPSSGTISAFPKRGDPIFGDFSPQAPGQGGGHGRAPAVPFAPARSHRSGPGRGCGAGGTVPLPGPWGSVPATGASVPRGCAALPGMARGGQRWGQEAGGDGMGRDEDMR